MLLLPKILNDYNFFYLKRSIITTIKYMLVKYIHSSYLKYR